MPYYPKQAISIGEIVDGERIACLLWEIAQRDNLSVEQIITVGAGANDLPMISIAGLGVAFNAKPVVRKKRPAPSPPPVWTGCCT